MYGDGTTVFLNNSSVIYKKKYETDVYGPFKMWLK